MHYELVSNSVYVFQSDVKTKARRQLPNDDWIRKCPKEFGPHKSLQNYKTYTMPCFTKHISIFSLFWIYLIVVFIWDIKMINKWILEFCKLAFYYLSLDWKMCPIATYLDLWIIDSHYIYIPSRFSSIILPEWCILFGIIFLWWLTRILFRFFSTQKTGYLSLYN